MDSAKCRAFKHLWEGYVYEEKHPRTNKKVWVARLDCPDCKTRKVEFMVPKTCELISRNYYYDDDYERSLSHADARKIVFTGMLTK